MAIHRANNKYFLLYKKTGVRKTVCTDKSNKKEKQKEIFAYSTTLYFTEQIATHPTTTRAFKNGASEQRRC